MLCCDFCTVFGCELIVELDGQELLQQAELCNIVNMITLPPSREKQYVQQASECCDMTDK